MAVDLRGHGASEAPNQQYSMPTFVDDLAWLCSQLRVARPVIVGHSMGGVVALEVVARYPEFAAGVVALDAPIVLPPERLARLRAVGEGFGPSDFRDGVRRFVEGMFLPTDDPSLRSRIADAMSGGPEHVLRSSWSELFACPSASAATATPIPVPVLAIVVFAGLMTGRSVTDSIWVAAGWLAIAGWAETPIQGFLYEIGTSSPGCIASPQLRAGS